MTGAAHGSGRASTGPADTSAPGDATPRAGRVWAERRAGCAVLWLDNPARRNALSRTMILDLLDLVRELDDEPEVDCIVVRGVAGTFCSGLDLTSLGGADAASDDHSMIDLAEQLERSFATLRTMSVAVVEGYAIGAGCQIALCCTIRLAAPASCFAIPVGRLGLVYPPTSVERLVELVGPSRAMLMLATGRRIDAPTAQLWGLATDLLGTSDGSLPSDPSATAAVDAGLEAFLADVAAGSRLSLTGSLEMVRAISGQAGPAAAPGTNPPTVATEVPARHDRAAAIYQRWSQLSEASGEHAEALAARAARRAPVFPWRPGA